MRLFQWSEACVIRIPQFDEEHRKMFDIGDELQRMADEGANLSQVQPKLRQLISLAIDHFSHEERRMWSTGCPSYAWHKREHDTAAAKVMQLDRRIRRGDAEALPMLLNYLSDWIKGHTGLADKMMAVYLRNYERERSANESEEEKTQQR